ncbi:MAG: hypothetical protein R3345_03910, partial [Fulvivirga sp.]|nr:hypothetical protein [Fulvivirga sp.]
LKEAVTADELNIEIRFLRLYIENSIPSYLRKEDNKKEDKRTIITHIDKLYAMNIGNDISNYIIGYITSPKVCDPEEITMIRQRLKLN